MLELTSTPKFTLVDRSLNNIPSIAITFPDGYEDTIVLDTFESNSEDENRMIGSSQSLPTQIESVNFKRARIIWAGVESIPARFFGFCIGNFNSNQIDMESKYICDFL